MTYATTPTIGIDINDATLPTVPAFANGMRVIFSNGIEALYASCAAATTITAGDLCLLEATGCVGVTTANTAASAATARFSMGVALVSMTAGTYAWFQTKGGTNINCAASVAVGAPLYTTTTAGQVSGTSTNSNLILGIQLATATTGAAVTACSLSSVVLARGTVGA
jgi:hypothetical protein